MNHLLLILIGGPAAMGVPAALAVLLCERHANQSAAAIREAFRVEHTTEQGVDRQKELTR